MSDSTFDYVVAIPYGKLGGDVTRCVESICRQTLAPQKVLVMCNGRVTRTHAEQVLAEQLLRWGHLIDLVQPPNCRNANDARNTGIDMATTTWIAFMDSDDWWEPGWMAAAAATLLNEGKQFVYGSIRVHSGGGSTEDLIGRHWRNYATPQNYLLAYMPAQTSTYVLTTELARRVRWQPALHRHQDYDFFERCVNSGARTGVVPGVFVNVEWAEARRHKHHLDCLRVVTPWRSAVEARNYRRHIKNLFRSALASRDWRAVPRCAVELARAIVLPHSAGRS